VRESIPDGRARRDFARRFHASVGYLPGAEATRAYAAAQILRAAGSDRASVRRGLRSRPFDTVAGPVRFDADGYRGGSQLSAADP
jgi:ABC-type branched-subunit amino acid transport system substrate-binding protein